MFTQPHQNGTVLVQLDMMPRVKYSFDGMLEYRSDPQLPLDLDPLSIGSRTRDRHGLTADHNDWGRNLTESLLTRMNPYATPLFEPHIGRLRSSSVLFVPGIFSNIIDKLCGPYFADQMAVCRDLGLSYERLPQHTHLPFEVTAPLIASGLENCEQTLLVTHSKGGLDVLHCLLEYPHLRAKVRGWIALQTPFFGSQLADQFADHRWMRPFGERFMKLTRGHALSMYELTTSARLEYMRMHASEIARLTREVPVLCIATWKAKPASSRVDSVFKLTRDFLLQKGFVSDGLVPVGQALLPYSSYAFLADTDHATTVVRNPFGSLNRTRFFAASLRTWLDIEAARDQAGDLVSDQGR